MKPRIYKTKIGYDIITSDLRLYSWNGKVNYYGRINESKFQPSGRLLKVIPKHLRKLFYSLQDKNNDQSPSRSPKNL